MKKLISTLLSFLFVFTLLGQFEKGKTMIGGEGALIHVSLGGFNSTALGLLPSYGYAVSDGLFLGSDLFFTTGEGTQFGLTPFLRKYFTQSEKGGFFGELSGGFVTGDNFTTGVISPSVGYTILAGSNLMIDLGLNYERNFNSDLNIFSLGFGIRGLLGKSNTDQSGN